MARLRWHAEYGDCRLTVEFVRYVEWSKTIRVAGNGMGRRAKLGGGDWTGR